MIEQLRLVFQSYTKALETVYVLEDAKPVARIMVFEDDLETIERKVLELKLAYRRSDYKIRMEVDHAINYSNKGERIDYESYDKGWVILYISKKGELAEKAKSYEQLDNHVQLGLLLGYPACCCEFFVKHVEEQSQKNNDYVLPIIETSYGNNFDFRNNILLRYFDVTLLNHFPHSFECQESIQLAQKYLDIIKKDDYYLYKRFSEELKTTVLYHEDFGIFAFENALFNKGMLRYSGVKASSSNYIASAIQKNKALEYDKRTKRIILEGKKMDDWHLLIFE